MEGKKPQTNKRGNGISPSQLFIYLQSNFWVSLGIWQFLIKMEKAEFLFSDQTEILNTSSTRHLKTILKS